MSNEPIKVLVDTVLKLERRGATRSLVKIIGGTHPADLAHLMRFLPDTSRAKIFRHIDTPEIRAEVLSELDRELLPLLLEQLADDDLVPLLNAMSGDDTVYVLAGIEDEERRERLLGLMKAEEVEETEEMLRYGSESAGAIMSTDVFALTEDTTCKAAIEVLQAESSDLEMVFYVYVINAHKHLVGVLSLRQLVISSPTTTLSEIMDTDVVRVEVTSDREDVAQIVARYNLLAVPVVDQTNHLVGIVTVDDVIDVIREEATEDMLKLAGAGDASLGLTSASVVNSTRSRLPWLFASWMGGVAASFIIQSYDEQLNKVALLAAFIPVIIGMGGNIGTQSLTIVTRGLALGHVEVHHIFRVVARELLVGMACGVFYGVLLGGVGWLLAWMEAEPLNYGSPMAFGLTVAVSLCSAMVIAASVGSSVPMIFERLSIDPAVATGPFVTTAVDVLGILVYFGAASLFMGL